MSSAVNLCFVVFRFGCLHQFFSILFFSLHFRHKGKRGSLKVRDSYHDWQDATSWNGCCLFFWSLIRKFANF